MLVHKTRWGDMRLAGTIDTGWASRPSHECFLVVRRGL